jgi:diaminohydroxyphosphoribosylaminopyrimidine deaminase/5-amino-6-(5-phosphoribosylamino)uracil reductase
MELKLVRTAREVPVWIVTGKGANVERVRAFESAGVRVFQADVQAGALSLSSVLGQLTDAGISRLLVEGGETIWRSFAAERLVDEVALFQAGGDGKGQVPAATLAARYAPGLDLTLTTHRRVGSDALSIYRVVDLPRPDVGRSA